MTSSRPGAVTLGTAPAPRLAAPSSLSVSAFAFVLLHAPLALLMKQVPALATLHAMLTIGIGLTTAFGGELRRVVYVVAYIAGAEVLWRMCGAQVFWETGKYAVLAIALITSVRMRPLRWQAWPALYLLLLVPSIAVTPYDLLSTEARQQISFNLSGPAALASCAFMFSQIRLRREDWHQTVVALLGPLLGIAAVAISLIVTANRLVFTLESNPVTSGGFGPNQVSAMLGLGALLAFVTAIERVPPVRARLLMFGFTLLFALQSALTFSRGGLLTAAGAAVVASLYLLRDARSRITLVVVAGALALTGKSVILPFLDQLTGGRIATRFESLNTTGRAELAREDLRLLLEHPVLGVGPGGSRALHRGKEPAHTELTRLLAEHGALGVGALAALLAMCLQAFRSPGSPRDKALAVALLTWSLLTMMHAAMRTVAPAVAFGLAFATLPSLRRERTAWTMA